LKIGYLHLGPPTSGLYRYSQLLAAEARGRSELTVIEADFPTIPSVPNDLAALRRAGRKLAAAEVVHLQYNTKVWGLPGRQRWAVAALLSDCAAPLVVTLHDIYPCYGTAEMVRRSGARLLRRIRSVGRLWTAWPPGSSQKIDTDPRADRTLGWRRGATAGALRLVLSRAAKILVCTDVERGRLASIGLPVEATVVPHFVEVRSNLPTPADARRQLGLENRRVITLLGMIVARKGHRLLLDAIPHLPADMLIVLAGGAAVGGAGFVAELADQIDSQGLLGRVRITGYLPESELERWLAATHLAVCPFETASASGSLATWISAAKPIVASDLPQIAELNRTVPRAIGLFRPYTAAALAAAIVEHLAARGTGSDPAVAELRQLRALPTVFDQHVAVYRQVAAQRKSLPASKGFAS
jgi:glycosyltransferase involved in cell wall biosynthesis